MFTDIKEAVYFSEIRKKWLNELDLTNKRGEI